MAKKKNKDVPNLIVFSDPHIGCRLGLCPPEGMRLDDGGRAMPSPLQLKVWAMWTEFWDVWVPDVCRGEPFAVVCNGDAMDGVHHGATTQMSQNLGDQTTLAHTILEPVVERCGGRYYHIRGREAHTGKAGVEEERLAEKLGAIPNKEGQYARWELWIELHNKGHRGLIHLMHHISTAGSMAYETTAVQKELEQAFVESGRWDDEIPDVVARSHRHRNCETRIQTYKGFATSFTTAGWQLKTPFVYKVAGARQSQPQIGGSLVRCGDEDVYTRHRLWKLDRPKVEVPCLK